MKTATGQYILVTAICLLLFPLMLAAAETPDDEDWFDDDSESRALQVNEGQLKFIAPIADRPILHSDKQLWITSESRQSGWVRMQQCYRHLDAVGRTDVVFAYREMRDLQVIRAERIGQIRIEQNNVELDGVEKGAVLCVQADIKILQRLSDKTYRLQNGPYHRKFLDGYYPYHVSLRVHYSDAEIRLQRVVPEAQAGFSVTEENNGLSIDSWFEGELRINLEFMEI